MNTKNRDKIQNIRKNIRNQRRRRRKGGGEESSSSSRKVKNGEELPVIEIAEGRGNLLVASRA